MSELSLSLRNLQLLEFSRKIRLCEQEFILKNKDRYSEPEFSIKMKSYVNKRLRNKTNNLLKEHINLFEP